MRAIEAAGIKKIEGDLIGDDTYFRGPRQGAGWSWDDLEYYYGAEASALTIQDNVIDLWIRPGEKAGLPCVIEGKPETSFVRFVNRTTSSSGEGKGELSIYRPLGENIAYISGNLPLKHAAWVDSVTVSKPALWFVTLLKSALPSEMVKGDVKSRSWPVEAALQTNDFIELAHFESPPLSELLPKMLKPSQNLYAQLLLLQAGATSARSSDTNRTTEELGLEALHAFVARAGINPKEVLLEEGSGLSRSGLVTPHATVELLQFMHREANAKLFHDSLAEPGSEGTLRKRLKELKGNLFAKTGSLSYVDSLSGYMKSAAGEELAFSIMLNAYNEESASKAREDLDVIPRLLGRLNQKSDH